MTQLNYIPEGYERIKVVDDLYSFFTTDFEPKANVVIFPRRLVGDFDVLAQKMAVFFALDEEEIFIKYSDRAVLDDFRMTLSGDKGLNAALDIIMQDMECLFSAQVKTHMRLLYNYKIHADTYQFHVDGLEQDFDRFMTCYNNPVTQFIRNQDVLKVDGHDALCRADATVYQFHVGDLWKSRVRNKPKNKVDSLIGAGLREKERRAFVHRAPPSDRPRLMVVGDRRVH